MLSPVTVVKVVEEDDWLLIYGSAQVLNLIPKAGMTDINLVGLREVFGGLDIEVKLLG